MTVAPYRSTKSVPDRVDRAWHQGYDAGAHRWKTVALVELAVGIWTVAQRRRTPVWIKVGLFYSLLLLMFVAVVIAPVVAVVLLVRAVVRRRSSASLRPAVRASLNDGEGEF